MVRIRVVSLTLSMLCAVAGCRSADTAPPSAEPATAADDPVTPGPERFGEPLRSGDAVAVEALLEQPDHYASSTNTVIVEGTVRRACSVKGCWMELAGGMDKALPGCRVTFKDYGFFVPLDSAGARARAEGVVHAKIVSQGEVRHMEAEGATFGHKLDDGSAREVRLVATGVELTR